MDSDEDFEDDRKASTSSGKGPSPIKRPKRATPLTPAERKAKSRAAQTVEKKEAAKAKNRTATAKSRADQTVEKKKVSQAKNNTAMAKT